MISTRPIVFATVTLLSATVSLAACGDDETSTTTSTTSTTASTGGGGAGGDGGAGGSCQTCSELVINNAPPTAACPGTSTTLIGELVTCLCQDTVCGGMGQGCFDACTNGTQPDAACLACDQMAFMGACMTEGAACMADEP